MKVMSSLIFFFNEYSHRILTHNDSLKGRPHFDLFKHLAL